METNLEKAKRLTKAHAAIKGIDLSDDNYFFKMLELAATTDVINKNDCIADVINPLPRYECKKCHRVYNNYKSAVNCRC